MKSGIIKGIFIFLVGFAILAGLIFAACWWYVHPPVTVRDQIVYTQRNGEDLSFSVITPGQRNGLGVVYVASGAWRSGPKYFRKWLAAPLLRRGYTIFTVYHLSQPKANVSEMNADTHRAIRYIRLHACEFGIDPQRLGIAGASSGGHLGMLVATSGGYGPAEASDPIDREDSSVQAAAVFFPISDFLNFSGTRTNGYDSPSTNFTHVFGPQSTNNETWVEMGRAISPIYHIKSNMPPILIHHGDADTVVPLNQSQRFQQNARKLGNEVKIQVHPGGNHGWRTMFLDIHAFADWFDLHLSKTKTFHRKVPQDSSNGG